MKFLIKHDIKGRIRVQMCQTRMTFTQADMLQYYLERQRVYPCSEDSGAYTGCGDSI